MKTWLRLWRIVDIKDIADSLLVAGLLNAECFSCRAIGLSKDSITCPECKREFRYIGFRGKVSPKELDRLSQNRNLIFVDFEDFSKEFNRLKARKFLDSA
jgi:hypothetical protein